MEPAMKASASTVNPTKQESYGLPQRTETGNESQGTAVESQGTDTPTFRLKYRTGAHDPSPPYFPKVSKADCSAFRAAASFSE